MVNLKKNFAYQIAYQILTIIFPLITSPYLSRVLGPEGLGEYSYTYSIAYYFSLFILLGVNNYGTREIAKVKDNTKERTAVFWSIYYVQFGAGIIIVTLYILTQMIFRQDSTLASVQLLYVLSAVLDINWLFFGLERFKVTVTRNCIVKIITVLAIFIFVQNNGDTTIYAVIMALGFLLSQLALWPFVKSVIVFKKIDRSTIVANIKPLLVLFVPVIAVSLFKYMDKIMLGAMYSKRELGLYDNTEKIMSIPTSVITAVGTVMLPRISYLIDKTDSESKIMKYINLSMSGSLMVGSALAFGMAAIADNFSIWFWGEEFACCGNLIKAISITVIFLSWANVIRTQYLIPYDKNSVFVRATIYGATINIIINTLLIKKYGAMGTVIGTVAAEFVVAFYQTIKCKKELPVLNYFIQCIPYISAGIVMYITITCVSFFDLANFPMLILQIVCGGFVYICLILIYIVYFKKITLKEIIKFVRR